MNDWQIETKNSREAAKLKAYCLQLNNKKISL